MSSSFFYGIIIRKGGIILFSIWTESYIVYEGKKVYLETSYSELKRKMKNSAETIEVVVSGLVFGTTKVLKKEKISEFGESGII